ncbi:MAG: metal ABC transporter permease [Actinomycetota bacterium]|nr:metal ABC transporter permease [Actinomycetota bacterium]
MLEYGFMQKAIAGGIIAAIACSLISFFVVVRRLAFVGMGISHAAFGGVAIGLALGINPIVTAGIFCSLVSLGIGVVSKKGRVHEDTAIGILFVSAMALGVLLVRVAHAYNIDLMSYLFGSILALGWGDVLALGITTLFSTLFTVLFFKELLFLAFDEETATASGVPSSVLFYGLLLTMAVLIVVSIKLLGIILVSALLVIPASVGMQIFKNYRGVIIASLSSAVVSVLIGLYLSWKFDLASGAAIVLVMFLIFAASFILSPRRRYMEGLVSRIGSARRTSPEKKMNS